MISTIKTSTGKMALSAFCVMTFSCCAISQTPRYFEFRLACGHGNWQDTSLIAATSDQNVIDSVLAQLAKPFAQRNKFITGNIAAGNAGYNHNASHWFKWHFVEDEWQLAQFAVEVCDGCPYTDVDADTAYWFDTLGFFCPWSGFPAREVQAPVGVDEPVMMDFSLYPNPAHDQVALRFSFSGTMDVMLCDISGREVKKYMQVLPGVSLELDGLEPGTYIVTAAHAQQRIASRLIVAE